MIAIEDLTVLDRFESGGAADVSDIFEGKGGVTHFCCDRRWTDSVTFD